MVEDNQNSRLGELAIRFNLLTTEQVAAALAVPSGDPDGRAGAPFLAAGLLTDGQIDFLLQAERLKAEWPLETEFGEMAIAEGWATAEAITSARDTSKRWLLQKKQLYRLGDVLVQVGVLTVEQRDHLLARQGRLATTVEGPNPLGIAVSEDGLQASIERFGDARTVDEVRAALQQNGIVFGLDEAAIHAALAAGRTLAEPLIVARGEAPVAGRNATIEYLFDTEPLKAGRQDEHGNIDFRDRGEIPQVEAGAVLARKHPPEPGRPGMDVRNRPIPVPSPRDPALQLGRGVRLDADGMTVSAEVSGYPSLTATGTLSVFPEYRIEGDLGLKTGHVDFEGRVVVTGTVVSGFRVRCGELVAEEVEEAEVEVEGDVLVKGGVIGARIRAGGAFKAHYLHGARLASFGDTLVDGEVLDSEVETSGKFLGARCVIFGSRISAKGGIHAKEVGSDSSPPCHLTVGIDERVLRETTALAEQQGERQAELDELIREAEALPEQQAATERRIGELAQVQDRAMVEKRSLGASESAQLAELDDRAAEAAAELEAAFGEQDAQSVRAEAITARQAELTEAIAALATEAARLRAWSEEHPGCPELRVEGVLSSGTVVRAPHTEARMSGEHRRVWFEEAEVTTADGAAQWRLTSKY